MEDDDWLSFRGEGGGGISQEENEMQMSCLFDEGQGRQAGNEEMNWYGK